MVIVGDVNPGSEIIATGDILIMGNLRGWLMQVLKAIRHLLWLHSGYNLHKLELQITFQDLRKAKRSTQFPEIARLKERGIVIEPYNVLNTDIYKEKREGIKWVRLS